MVIYDVEQGTPEWYAVKAGIPSASEFDKIITAGGQPSKQQHAYQSRLLAEKMLGRCIEGFAKTPWMDRGNELEAEAADFYSMSKSLELKKVGFITNDRKTLGCSPDRIVGEDGLVELKCPAHHTHVDYLEDPLALKKDYHVQVQGQLLVTARKWADLVSYCPEMPPVIVRVEADTAFQIALKRMIDEFNIVLERRRLALVRLGHIKGEE